MRQYANFAPSFWTGETGRQFRGDHTTQLVLAYLITSPSSNMLGLYYLPIPMICYELSMSERDVRKGLQRGFEGGFCDYDEPSETVFVYRAAHFQIGPKLKRADNRVKSIESMIRGFCKSVFYNDFLDLYGEAYSLNLDELRALAPKGLTKPLRSPPVPVPVPVPDPVPDPVPVLLLGATSAENEPTPPPALPAPAEKPKPAKPKKPPAEKAAGYAGDFERWWALYPLKQAKRDASEAFAKALKRICEARECDRDYALDWLCDVTAQFGASPKGKGEFVPNPATWLNGSRFDDDPSAWERDSSRAQHEKKLDPLNNADVVRRRLQQIQERGNLNNAQAHHEAGSGSRSSDLPRLSGGTIPAASN